VSLKDEINEYSFTANAGETSRGRCSVKEWLKTQDEVFNAEFKDVLETRTSTMQIYRFLQHKFTDLPFKLTTFRFHRNQWCSCQ
jgi:hypothetical protein